MAKILINQRPLSDLVKEYEGKFETTFYRGQPISGFTKEELMAVICDIGQMALKERNHTNQIGG